jgi:hypothetical protein
VDVWTVAQQPVALCVAVRSEIQASMLALHKMRAQLMNLRIMPRLSPGFVDPFIPIAKRKKWESTRPYRTGEICEHS